MKNYAVILASGKGTRYGSEIPKQFVKIRGKTIFEHSIEAFQKSEFIDYIVIVVTPEYRDYAEEILLKHNYDKVIKLLNGGEIRKESSYIGVNSIEDKEANVLIHDCARPLVTQKIIKECVESLKEHNAVNVAIPVTDTVITVKNNLIESIPERKYLMQSQTPQCFKLSLIKKAHELSKNDSNFTDDCGLIIKYGLDDIYIVDGDKENIKITYALDMYLAEKILKNRKEIKGENND